MTDAAEKMRVEVKVMVLETLISIMRDEKSENRDRLKAIEVLDKMLMSGAQTEGEEQWLNQKQNPRHPQKLSQSRK